MSRASALTSIGVLRRAPLLLYGLLCMAAGVAMYELLVKRMPDMARRV